MTKDQIIKSLETEIKEHRDDRKEADQMQKQLLNGRIEGMQYAISLLKK